MLTSALAVLILFQAPAESTTPAARAPATCSEWRECQRRALEAADRGAYESFHDLMWRAVQIGPAKDPTLMYLLARAQCLSGRPHDALVMLQRIAEMGVATDAATNDDFRRTRELPGWPDVQVLIEAAATHSSTPTAPAPRRVTASAPATAPSRSSTASTGTTPVRPEPAPAVVTSPPPVLPPPAPSVRASSAVAVNMPPIEQAARISSARFAPAGLAYDAVSQRFVVGDLHGRKLMVVADGADHAIDLVRDDSAGFRNIASVEIDERRGDLWVASASEESTDWTMHKLQLVSGRPLKAVRVDQSLEPLQLVDIAVTPGGTILTLDAAGSRILALRPDGETLRPLVRLVVKQLTSLTASGDESVAYASDQTGIVRIDLKSGVAVPVVAPSGTDFASIERLRWYRNSLITVDRTAGGDRRIRRLTLNGSGRTITAATPLAASIPVAAGPTFATVSGDDLCYLVVGTSDAAGDPAMPLGDVTIRRIHLR